MPGYFELDPRSLLPEDAQGTRILLMGALGVTPYIDRALEVLAFAERGNDSEHKGMVIARDGTVAGLALFGTIAGTAGGARLHTAALAPGVQADDVGERLLRAVSDASRSAGARYLLAEMPDDPALGTVLALLREHGFREEARVPDFYREGVALTFLRLDL
ncbi:MAG TPA: GNAT family N-acetyltransferase [Gemmatimonadaceae bacterium]